jgi:hypothetical protein
LPLKIEVIVRDMKNIGKMSCCSGEGDSQNGHKVGFGNVASWGGYGPVARPSLVLRPVRPIPEQRGVFGRFIARLRHWIASEL